MNTFVPELIYDSISSIPALNAAETICNIFREKRQLSATIEVRWF